MTESEMTAKIVHELKYTHKAFVIKIHGGIMQMAGLPDTCILYQGEDIWVEFKGENTKLRPLQIRVIEEMKKQGADVFVVRFVEPKLWIIDDLYEIKFGKFKYGVELLLYTLVSLCHRGVVV